MEGSNNEYGYETPIIRRQPPATSSNEPQYEEYINPKNFRSHVLSSVNDKKADSLSKRSKIGQRALIIILGCLNVALLICIGILGSTHQLNSSKATDCLPESCKEVNEEIRNDTGEIFRTNFTGLGKEEVFCDAVTDGGGWTVFQRRMDGSVDFFLGWNDYVNGFGNKQGEFWLGLEAIHQMTKNGDRELRIDMITRNGAHVQANYRLFSIGPASENYRISVRGYSGNSTYDNMASSHSINNMMFSTKDSDHDGSVNGSCAWYYTGAWWYDWCTNSNLNGEFKSDGFKGIWWDPHNLRFTELKFRKKE